MMYVPVLLSAAIVEELEVIWVCCLCQQPHENKTDQQATYNKLKSVPTLPR